MDLLTFGLLSQVVGSILLSLHIFKSKQEENDEASSWWGGNPFSGFNSIRKAFSFIGLVFVIFGFSTQLYYSLSSTVTNNEIIFPTMITGWAIIFMISGYCLSGMLYLNKRYKHFAKLALNSIEDFQKGKVNSLSLFSSLKHYTKDLPRKYSQIIDGMWTIIPNIIDNEIDKIEDINIKERLEKIKLKNNGVILIESDSFHDKLNELKDYLVSVSNKREIV